MQTYAGFSFIFLTFLCIGVHTETKRLCCFAWGEGTRTHNAHTETWQSIARCVLVYIYHATASYRIGQQGSKIYNTYLSEAKTLLKRERKSTNKDREQSEHLIEGKEKNVSIN